jgi:hypothetical protein
VRSLPRLPTLSVRVRASIAAALCLGAWVALMPVANAYIGQNPYAVRLDGPTGIVACAQDVVITALVRDATTGEPVAHQFVLWDLKTSVSSRDSLSHARTTTADDGTTSVTLTFGAETGKRVVRADIADFPIELVVRCSTTVPVVSPTPVPSPTVEPLPTATPTAGPPTPSPAAASPTPVTSPGPSPSPTADGTVTGGTGSGIDGTTAGTVILVGGVGALAAGLYVLRGRRRAVDRGRSL